MRPPSAKEAPLRSTEPERPRGSGGSPSSIINACARSGAGELNKAGKVLDRVLPPYCEATALVHQAGSGSPTWAARMMKAAAIRARMAADPQLPGSRRESSSTSRAYRSPTATTVIRRAETLAGTGVLPAPWGIERHDKKLEIRRNRLVTETLELSITGARSIKFKGFKLQPLSLSLRHGAAKDLD